MFSFFKIFNSKADTDKDKSADSLCGKTMNLNSPEAKALHVFNQKLLVGTKTNGNNTPVRYVHVHMIWIICDFIFKLFQMKILRLQARVV